MKWMFVSSCVHLGGVGCRLDLFRASLKEAKRRKAVIALIGDTLDVGSFVGTAHQGSVWDNTLTPQEQLDQAIKELKPYAKQIEVILSGNHELRLAKAAGLLLNKIVAQGIGREAAFKDDVCRYRLGARGSIFLSHGANKSDFNRVLQGTEALDAVVLGHTHQLYAERVRRRGTRLRDILLVRAGTYLQEPRYGRLALYPPNPVGGAWLSLGSEIRVELGVKPRP